MKRDLKIFYVWEGASISLAKIISFLMHLDIWGNPSLFIVHVLILCLQ